MSEGPGRITFVFAPAGLAEAFFLKITERERDGTDGPGVLAAIRNGIDWATLGYGMNMPQC